MALIGPPIEFRLRKELKHTQGYKACARWNDLPQLGGIGSPLAKAERIIGAYENSPGHLNRLLLFTNTCIHLWEAGTWRSIRYSDIHGTDWPPGDKMEAHTLVVRLKNGDTERLPVLRGTQVTRDFFSVMGFINLVVRRKLWAEPCQTD